MFVNDIESHVFSTTCGTGDGGSGLLHLACPRCLGASSRRAERALRAAGESAADLDVGSAKIGLVSPPSRLESKEVRLTKLAAQAPALEARAKHLQVKEGESDESAI